MIEAVKVKKEATNVKATKTKLNDYRSGENSNT